MKDRGKTVITSTPYSSRQDKQPDETGICFVVLLIVFLVFLLAIIPNHKNNSAGQEESKSPRPPASKFAYFQSSSQESKIPPISVVFTGDSYELLFKTSKYLEEIKANSSQPFVVNFNTGVISGDQKNTDTFILIGKLDLSLGYLSDNDDLYVNILKRNKNTQVYINYEQYPRPPPVSTSSQGMKKIIIVGELSNISASPAYGNSNREVHYLDLNPSEMERLSYEMAVKQYEREIEIRREIKERVEIRAREVRVRTIPR